MAQGVSLILRLSIHTLYIDIPLFCVGVMYSGEYDACDVTLSVYPHRASLKNMPDHGGNRTYDLWNTSPMFCQLSYAARSVRICDFSEQNLVPSISMYLIISNDQAYFWRKWRKTGVAYPYMDTTRHFHVVFDVRVLDLNLSNMGESSLSLIEQIEGVF